MLAMQTTVNFMRKQHRKRQYRVRDSELKVFSDQ